MPPRSEEEVDVITLHNQALMNMEEKPTEGFEKLQFLLQQGSFPPEAFANLLILYCKYEVRAYHIRMYIGFMVVLAHIKPLCTSVIAYVHSCMQITVRYVCIYACTYMYLRMYLHTYM